MARRRPTEQRGYVVDAQSGRDRHNNLFGKGVEPDNEVIARRHGVCRHFDDNPGDGTGGLFRVPFVSPFFPTFFLNKARFWVINLILFL